ncbi:acyl-CoA carboxylase subunit epsilon [Arthrobacter sp. NPDC090010]|uniref:acyl-CoA carboxylase subunit epsilon n=1 Tax=Arthrobacter sp. NPDC090010 TaxID=3363942 RepID=UPI0037F134C9
MATNSTGDAGPETSAAQPFLTVTKGDPTAEELAALSAVVGALATTADAESADAPRHSERFWRRRAQFNVPLKAGPGAWRRSGR